MTKSPWNRDHRPPRRGIDWLTMLIVGVIVIGSAVITGELLRWYLFP